MPFRSVVYQGSSGDAGITWRFEDQARPPRGRVLVRRISNPLEVIEQITYLLFNRRPDGLAARAEWRAG